MKFNTDDVRIGSLGPLIPPAILMEELPVEEAAAECIGASRITAANIIAGRDDRLLVVVGPCSIHDPDAALEYARRLREQALLHERDLFIVMRTYFEKPRTTVGWKGLINDPRIDGSFKINEGLRVARGVLHEIAAVGLPMATEFLDPITPQFVADFIAWAAIGARTTESQVHRELASGLSMPVGFKNGTSGAVQIAVDAIRSAAHQHHFLSVTKQGLAAIVSTNGNPDCHLILRGGADKANYDASSVSEAAHALRKAGLRTSVMIDCSHANSGKDPSRQPVVARDVAAQVTSGSRTIIGVMLESFIEAGAQREGPRAQLRYGQSITDACLSWTDTLPVLTLLANASRQRRNTIDMSAPLI
ncbi:MAG TPA: 3-deoxy-7-phosphoheptulonate synthase [Polyangiaceae bacterium]